MFLIHGINHARAVGILKEDGTAAAFSPDNERSFRAPKTIKETAACVRAAKEYYDNCAPSVRDGKFGLIPTESETVQFISDIEILTGDLKDLLALLDGENPFILDAGHSVSAEAPNTGDDFERKAPNHTCKYCGRKFFSHLADKDVCNRADCLKKQHSDEKK